MIYQNIHASEKGVGWMRLNDADASGIGQRPEEIEFYDINGYVLFMNGGETTVELTKTKQRRESRLYLDTPPRRPCRSMA